jgi:hypothetical protein
MVYLLMMLKERTKYAPRDYVARLVLPSRTAGRGLRTVP